MKTAKLVSLSVLAFVSAFAFGSLVSTADASQASVDVPVRVYDLEPMTIIEHAPVASSDVIELAPVTIYGSARRGAVKASSVSRGAVSAPVRTIALSQGGRPGARSVRAWGI